MPKDFQEVQNMCSSFEDKFVDLDMKIKEYDNMGLKIGAVETNALSCQTATNVVVNEIRIKSDANKK